MSINDFLTPWSTAFGFKELFEESSVLRVPYLPSHSKLGLPVSSNILHIIYSALYLNSFDTAAGSVDVYLNPSCLQDFIKGFKTDPFRKECNVLIGVGLPPLCAVQAVISYLAHRGHCPGPLFLLENGLLHTPSLAIDRLRAVLCSAGLPGDFSSHMSQIGATHFCSKGQYSR